MSNECTYMCGKEACNVVHGLQVCPDHIERALEDHEQYWADEELYQSSLDIEATEEEF